MNEEIFKNCVESINPKWLPNLYAVDNSEEGYISKYGVNGEHHPENIGIARAWNIGARRVLKENFDYLVIMSATILFEKGMDDLVACMEANANPYGLETQHGWHLICFKPETFKRVGLFDENFYPAYFEDSDMIRRLELTGIHNPMSKTQRIPKVEIAAGFQGDAHAVKSGLKVNFVACENYFVDKWGHPNDFSSQEKRDHMFQYPFNNPKNGLDYWEPQTIEDLRENYEL